MTVTPASKNLTAFVESTYRLLRESGYRVEAPGTVEGVSGVAHEVDLLCYSDPGNILIDIRRRRVCVGAAPVLSLYLKTLDSKCFRAALIAVPRACALSKKLSRRYGLSLGEAESPLQAAAFLKKRVLQAMSPYPATAMDHSADAGRAQAAYSRRIRFRSVKSALDLLILLSLNRTSLTGYDVISSIQSRFNILLSPGTIYPILERLEKEGLITHVVEGRKKVYSTARKGSLVSNVAMREYMTIQRELLSHIHTFAENKASSPK